MSAHDLATELARAAYRFDFFAAMRLIESWHADKPRLGTSIKASDDPVKLRQTSELDFPASTLAEYVVTDQDNAHLTVNFMGLFGPNGALPLHLTEYARERRRHYHDPTFARFADIFHHRMISLFYRAWANVRPTVSFERPEDDRFGFYVGALSGVATPAFRNRDELADQAKWFYTAHFACQSKHPEGLRAIIGDILGLPVKIEEFVGEWMAIELAEQSRLGLTPNLATLGESALVGGRVWGCQHKFRVILGPMLLGQYLALLPGGVALKQLKAVVRQYLGDALVWEAQLILKAAEIPPELALGKTVAPFPGVLAGNAQLGWSMWLGPQRSRNDADDLKLDPFITK